MDGIFGRINRARINHFERANGAYPAAVYIGRDDLYELLSEAKANMPLYSATENGGRMRVFDLEVYVVDAPRHLVVA